MFSKPTVVVVLGIIFNKTVNTKTCAKVRKLGEAAAVVTLATKKNRGNNLIANLNRVALGVGGNAFANSYNLTCSLVSENDFFVAKGIVTIFVNVGSSNTAAFNLNKDFAGAGGRNFDVAKLCNSLALNTVNDFRLNKISHFRCCHSNTLLN